MDIPTQPNLQLDRRLIIFNENSNKNLGKSHEFFKSQPADSRKTCSGTLTPITTHLALVEKLWDKYAVSSRELEAERSQTLTELNEFLVKLGYLN
ncbi:hypothetical protein PLAN_150079 [Planktothrix rubescens CCAP 1459/22]|uniref:Uncharacterized protein n=1 Tax=Planktothrix rubescens CCAP 1459/22 TaxID=329571 RepID=A0A6J7ZJB4_PLARU|nr:hypothetical protein [Planktothrix rubescens]CAC5341971.1 hypothetical protein PLAN_150079 [Planktothrix rubescens NIVA-CYA 18]